MTHPHAIAFRTEAAAHRAHERYHRERAAILREELGETVQALTDKVRLAEDTAEWHREQAGELVRLANQIVAEERLSRKGRRVA